MLGTNGPTFYIQHLIAMLQAVGWNMDEGFSPFERNIQHFYPTSSFIQSPFILLFSKRSKTFEISLKKRMLDGKPPQTDPTRNFSVGWK